MGLLFDIDHQTRWQVAAQQLGVDFNKLSTDIGHA
jgi:putative transcriptional regulator